MKLARSPAAVANKQKYITIKNGNPRGDNKKYAVLVTIKKNTLFVNINRVLMSICKLCGL